jgi:hypothetical protein
MAYFIFLKYLRSLEEFRKNSHAKIPSKSPGTNFQSCQKFKIPNKNSKGFYYLKWAQLRFWPSHDPLLLSFPTGRFPPPRPRPLGRPSRPVRQWCPTRLLPSSRGSASSRAAFTPLRTRLTGGPHLSSLTSDSARVRPRSLPPLQPCCPALHLRMPPKPLPPHHHSPLIPSPLNLTPTFNGVKAINAVVTPATPPRRFPRPLPSALAPIKAPQGPLEHPTPHRALHSSSPTPERLPTEPPRPPPRHLDARLSHCRPRPGEPPTKLPAFHSSFAPWPAPLDTRMAGGRSSDELGVTLRF